MSHSVFLRMRNVSHKSLEKIETHFVFSDFFPKTHAIYEMMWKNIVE